MKKIYIFVIAFWSSVSFAAGFDGPYIGINGALSTGKLEWNGAQNSIQPDYSTDDQLVNQNNKGFSGGIQIGLNKLLEKNFLIGLEGSIDRTSIKADGVCLGGGGDQTANCKTKISSLGEISAKIGYLPNDNWLVYAKAGKAYARMTSQPDMVDNYSDYNYQSTKHSAWGWLTGVGVETKITNNLRN